MFTFILYFGISNDLQKNPGSLGFPGCALLALLRPVPPTLAPSLQRSRSVPRPVVLDVQLSHSSGAVFWVGDFPALGRRVQTDQYCNPIPGSPLWVLALVTRSLLSCGRWFLTHWRYPQSALGRWCLWLLRPIGYQTQASRCRAVVLRSKPCSPSQTNSQFCRTRLSPIDALRSSRNDRLVVPLV